MLNQTLKKLVFKSIWLQVTLIFAVTDRMSGYIENCHHSPRMLSELIVPAINLNYCLWHGTMNRNIPIDLWINHLAYWYYSFALLMLASDCARIPKQVCFLAIALFKKKMFWFSLKLLLVIFSYNLVLCIASVTDYLKNLTCSACDIFTLHHLIHCIWSHCQVYSLLWFTHPVASTNQNICDY